MEVNSTKACKLTGVTLRQIQWWDEKGAFCARRVEGPGSHGQRRTFDTGELTMLYLMHQLSEKGLGLKSILKLLLPRRPPAVFRLFVTDGRECLWTNDAIEALAWGFRRKGVFLVDLVSIQNILGLNVLGFGEIAA